MECKPAVLIVDNHPEIREVLAGLLEALCFETYRADGYAEALQQIDRPGVCAIVTDVEMHPETGFDLLAYSRKKYPGIPVIMVSSYGSPDMREQALKSGAAEFLSKPFTMEALSDALERNTRALTV